MEKWKVVKEGYKSTTLPVRVWEWLDAYKEKERLRSIPQAIEFVIREAGYDLDKPPLLIETARVR